MENKLQELTQKLYSEGLEKGKQESDRLIENAREQAEKIISDAKKQADDIIKKANRNADDLKRNTMTEISLASRETIGNLKQQIENLIVMKGVSPGVKEANADPEFIREMLIAITRNWNGGSSSKVELTALLPEKQKEELSKVLEGAAAKNLKDGLEIKFDKKVGSGFRIAPKNGGYYISFGDDDFDALLKSYLRPQVARMLFGE